MDEHEAKWGHVVAAHRIAKLNEEIAALLPRLVEHPALLDAYLPGLSTDTTVVSQLADMLKRRAVSIREAAPISVTEDQKWEIAELYAEAQSEASSRDVVRNCYDDLTDAEVAAELDMPVED